MNRHYFDKPSNKTRPLMLFLLALLFMTSPSLAEQTLTSIELTEQSEPEEVVADTVYIDVRTWAEHKIDHIDGDVRIHVSNIVQGVSEQFPDKSTPIKLYCRRGVRSSTAVERLKAAGYLDVENLGGINDARRKRGITIE